MGEWSLYCPEDRIMLYGEEALAAARAEGAAAERARIVAWLKSVDWNNLQENEDPWEGDHCDLARVIVEMVERGDHVKEDG